MHEAVDHEMGLKVFPNYSEILEFIFFFILLISQDGYQHGYNKHIIESIGLEPVYLWHIYTHKKVSHH